MERNYKSQGKENLKKIDLKNSSENTLIVFKGKGCTFREIVQALLSPYLGLPLKESIGSLREQILTGRVTLNFQMILLAVLKLRGRLTFASVKWVWKTVKCQEKNQGKSQGVWELKISGSPVQPADKFMSDIHKYFIGTVLVTLTPFQYQKRTYSLHCNLFSLCRVFKWSDGEIWVQSHYLPATFCTIMELL